MIAIDTCSLVAYLNGATGPDVERVDRALEDRSAVIPAPVLAEFLSDPHLPVPLDRWLDQIPVLDLKPGFWQRAGRTRAAVLESGGRAKLADTLIAQVCIDSETALVTRDPDFKVFQKIAGLKLA
jgi:predicted nucleic acid-binding protein